MTFGFHLLAWRRKQGLSQAELAKKASVLRPYLSRLERNKADPSLSVVQRIATAMDLSIGQFLDSLPPPKQLDRHKLDRLALSTLQRDKDLGIGDHALRRLRVQLGEDQWRALLKRMEKHEILLEAKQP